MTPRKSATVSRIGNPEGRLCGNLIASVARSFSGGKAGNTIGNISQSYWRKFADAVAEFALAERDGMVATYLRDANDMPDLLASAVEDGDSRIPRLLSAFLGVACSFGASEDACLADGREWFVPPEEYALAMQWLARTGYAERKEWSFRWTDKIAPAMRESYLWTDENQSIDAIERQSLEDDAMAAWTTMPDTMKQALRSGRTSFMGLVRMLALGWRDGEWHPYRADQRFDLTGQIALARRIVEIASGEAC